MKAVGFRHGPKSHINEDTVVLVFGSTTDYTRKYDLDLVREVAGDQIARRVVLLSDQAFGLENVKEVALGCGCLEWRLPCIPLYCLRTVVYHGFSLKLETNQIHKSTGTVQPCRSRCYYYSRIQIIRRKGWKHTQNVYLGERVDGRMSSLSFSETDAGYQLEVMTYGATILRYA